jgi:hypothetical protein
MPTADTRRMSPLVRRLYRRIVAERSCACFAETMSVEQAVHAYAAAIGVPVTELLHSWTGTSEQLSKAAPKRTPKLKVDDDEPMTRTCPTCDGTGRAKDGGVCPQCDGAGRIDNDPDDDEDEDE